MDLGPGHLLVVDDNEMNRDLLSRRLSKKGYRVQVAEGGAKALEMIEDEAFDLVLLDIMMPGMDGMELDASISHLLDDVWDWMGGTGPGDDVSVLVVEIEG